MPLEACVASESDPGRFPCAAEAVGHIFVSAIDFRTPQKRSQKDPTRRLQNFSLQEKVLDYCHCQHSHVEPA